MKLERTTKELYRNLSNFKNFFDTADTVGTVQEFLEYSIETYIRNRSGYEDRSIIVTDMKRDALTTITQAYTNIMDKYKKQQS